MRRRSFMGLGFTSAGLAALAIAGCATTDETTGDPNPGGEEGSLSPEQEAKSVPGGAGGDVGVFTWWADGSEKLGLEALQEVFSEQFAKDTFVNLAVAGGAGSNAKAKLAADLANNNPPDSFQGHAGAELLGYISKQQIVPVDDVIEDLGGTGVFPQNLLDLLTVKEAIYSVPSNIHRANVVWANAQVLEDAGISAVPADLDAWMADMDTLKSNGVSTPLSIGGAWTQVQLLETVLLSTLGADGYTALFTADGDWESAEVTTAAENYAQLLDYANTASDGDDWPPATDMVIDGKAAYNVMGDWAVAQFASKDVAEDAYSYFPVPGTDGVFDFLADSFTLPKGAKNPAGCKDWLMTVGSAEGQLAFNLAKGSIPARTDVAPDEFPAYQKSAMDSFANDTIVASIAHGAAVSEAWLSDITTAVSKFYGSKDTETLVSDLAAAASKHAG